MQMKTFKNGLKFTKLQAFAAVIMRGDDQMILRHLLSLQCDDDFGGVQWQNALNKLANVINKKNPFSNCLHWAVIQNNRLSAGQHYPG